MDYRIHDKSMISRLARQGIVTLIQDTIALPWRVKAEAQKQDLYEIVNHCWNQIVICYATQLFGARFRGYFYRLTVREVEASLSIFENNRIVRLKILTRVLCAFLPVNSRRCLVRLWRWASLDAAQIRRVSRSN